MLQSAARTRWLPHRHLSLSPPTARYAPQPRPRQLQLRLLRYRPGNPGVQEPGGDLEHEAGGARTDYASVMGRYHQQLRRARSVSAFMAQLQSGFSACGLEDFMLIPLADNTPSGEPPAGRYAAELRTLAPSAMGWLRHDLLVQHTAQRETPLLQSQVQRILQRAPFDCSGFRRQRSLHETLRGLGYCERYVVPVVLEHGRAAVMLSRRYTCGRQIRASVAAHRDELTALCTLAIAVGYDRFPRALQLRPGKAVLNGRPLQLLEVLAHENLTLKEAAQALHISISTANQHMATARRLLRARTTVQAVSRALRLGLIQL